MGGGGVVGGHELQCLKGCEPPASGRVWLARKTG